MERQMSNEAAPMKLGVGRTSPVVRVLMIAVVAAVALGLSLSAAPPATASAKVSAGETRLATSAGSGGPECSGSASTQQTSEITATGGDAAEAMTDAAKAAVERGEFSLHASESALRLSEAEVYHIESDEGLFTSVTVPVGGEYSLMSNVFAVFDEAGNAVQYGETLVSENHAGNFNVTTYIDGELTSDQDTGLSYMTDAELQQEIDSTLQDMPQGLNAQTQSTGACLAAVLGVSGVVGGIIAAACWGACASAAIGIGVPFCVGCVSAYAVVGGASITAVANCF